MTVARGFLGGFSGERKHKLAVNELAVGPRLEIKVLDD